MFWIIFLVPIFICYKFSIDNFQLLESEFNYEKTLHIKTKKEILILNKITIRKKCFFAGIIAGMLGIGGGMVITPYLLELGYELKEAQSTSNLLLIFSSSISFIFYLFSV